MIRLFELIAGGVRNAFHKPERWLIRCVIVASIIAVIYYSGDKAKDTPTQAILIFLGLAAVGFHYLGAQKACRSWYERKLGALVLWMMVILGAVSWELNSQLSIASNNQDNLKATRVAGWQHQEDARTSLAFAQTKAGAERKALEALRARVEAAASVSINGKPVTSPDVAQAEIDRLKGNVRFWTLTKGCTEAPGKQTRAYCDDYRAALAAKATAENRLTLEAEVKRQEAVVAETDAALVAAQSKASAAPAVTAIDRADLRNIKRLTGLTDADAELSQSLLLVAVMALFLTVAGWLLKAEEYEGKTLAPWIDWGRIGAWLRVIATGKTAPKGSHTIIERTIINDPFGKAFGKTTAK